MHSASTSIIQSRIIMPVISPKIGAANDIYARSFCCIPEINSIVISVVGVVEVIVIDEVVARRGQVDTVVVTL